MIHISLANYNHPIGLSGGYFKNKDASLFNVYQKSYHIYFLNYLYYLLVMKAKGDYPVDYPIEKLVEEIQKVLNEPSSKDNYRPIKKILIGEAPPENGNYFYDPNSAFVIGGGPWINSVKKSVLSKVYKQLDNVHKKNPFAAKIEFLKVCAKEGFLLLDLFPYAIKYQNRNSKKYADACASAFCGPYPLNIIDTLKQLMPCLDTKLSIGFGMKSFGEAILGNPPCVNYFNKCCQKNNITLNPTGSIDIKRTKHSAISSSNYLRIFHNCGGYGPHPNLLKISGF